MGKGLGLAFTILLFGGSRAGWAQVPDSIRVDTTAARDTTDRSGQFLATRQGGERTAVLPLVGVEGLHPPHSRMVFTRDSIEWTNAETLSDLLARIPGVFVWRGGWIGRAQMPNFEGRGATSAEYTLDGFPWTALGADSVAVDPTFFPLSFLERVEVERLPGLLRVHLFTKRHDRALPRSRIGVASGYFDIARYQGSLERRNASGFGFGLFLDHLSVPTQGDIPGAYRNTAALLQASLLTSDRSGLLVQYHRLSPDRELVLADDADTDTLAPSTVGRRTDLQARYHWREREDGTGKRIDLLFDRATWTDQEPDTIVTPDTTIIVDASRRLHSVGAVAAWRGERASVRGAVFYRSLWTPLDLRVSAGTVVGGMASASAEAAYLKHDGGRSSRWLLLRLGMDLPSRFTAAAAWRTGRSEIAPALPDTVEQHLSDRSLHLGWMSRRAEFEVGYSRTAEFIPRPYREFPTIPRLDTIPATDWLTVRGRLALRQWFSLEGWYSNPVGDPTPVGTPRTHSAVTATIRSKFLRTYRSGIFDLKVQLGMETWGTAVIGLDQDGNPIALPGATFLRGQIQLQFDSFIAYFDQWNMGVSRLGYIPGFPIPRAAQTFGVRWEFLN